MKRCIAYSLVLVAILVSGNAVYAEHNKDCKNIHGKVTVVTRNGITVDDKLFKVGKTTRITRADRKVTLDDIHAGDVVCLDPRGSDDIGGGEVAAVTVLTASEPTVVKKKEYTLEKETVQRVVHDKSCNHVHGKVTRIEDSTIIVDGKPHTYTTTTLVTKDGQTKKVETLKVGDFVCLGEDDDKVTSVVVLSAPEAEPFQSREVIRERIREEK